MVTRRRLFLSSLLSLFLAWGIAPLSGATPASPAAAASFSPMKPVNTAGPRETIADLYERTEEIQRLLRTTLDAYLASDRLYPSSEEQRAMALGREMAQTAAHLMDVDSLPQATRSLEFDARMLLTLRALIARLEMPPLESIPSEEVLVAMDKDRWRIPGTMIEIRRMGEGPREGEWLFTASTIRRLPEWYEQLEPSGGEQLRGPAAISDKVLNLYTYAPLGLAPVIPLRWLLALPAPLEATWLNQPAWRWLALAVLTIIGLTALRLVHRVSETSSKTKKIAPTLAPWGSLMTPVALALIVLLLHTTTTEVLRFSAPVYVPLISFYSLLSYIAMVWVTWSAAQAIAETIIGSGRLNTRSIDGQLVRLTLRLIAVFVALGIIIEGASRLGLPAYSVLTGLGIGGVAVALAARESLANVMGAFIVMIEKPFRVGHWIRVGDIEGTVEDIGFRSMRLRTFYDSLVTVPSSTILESTVDNMGERRYRQVKTTLALTYDTPPARLSQFIEAVRGLIETHPASLKGTYHVVLHDFGESSLDVLLSFFLDVPDRSTELQQREDILMRILECADRLGVSFAFPTRLIRFAQEDKPADLAAARTG